MKKVLIISFLLSQIIFSQNKQITTFDELITSLQNGCDVRVIVEYQKCKLFIDSNEVNSVNAIGGMDISTFEYFAKGSIRNEKAYLVFSENVLISHKKYGYVYNYAKFRVFEDNEVEITARYLRTDNFEVVMDEVFYCKINNGSNGEGIFFYIK
jgi:hypothetical protein